MGLHLHFEDKQRTFLEIAHTRMVCGIFLTKIIRIEIEKI